MNEILLNTYHKLPYTARCAAAGLFGAYLNRWRYTPETERLVEEALEREQWTPAAWETWQQDALARVLHRAASRVPYYRDYWTGRKRKGDNASAERLENWPVLEKDELRRNPAAFVADDCDTRRMFAEHTSGTTGKPLTLWRSRETVRQWYALHEARARVWYGISRAGRWAIVGGQRVVPVQQRKPPFWVWNPAQHQLYLSSYHVAPQHAAAYLDALERYRIESMLGYTASITTIAAAALQLGRRLPMKVVVTNAEPLSELQRATISRAFECPVRETYGLAEIVAAASECHSGRLHLWPEVGLVEVGEDGELICTGLMNPDMPLIRYRSGDRGSLPAGSDTACACGRKLPFFGNLEGRADDVLYMRDGRQIGRMDPVFKADLPIEEAQIIQESLDRLRLRYVPAPGFTNQTAQGIVRRIQAFVGPVEVVMEEMVSIPREANGKFRAVVCRLAPEERPVPCAHAGSAR